MRSEGGRLVLFDIDGTLLSAGRVFKLALTEALHKTFGSTGPWGTYDFSGKTDPQIVRDLMRGAGLPERTIDGRLAEALGRYRDRLLELIRPEDVTPKPGALALVESLVVEPCVTLGLLTGNLEACARAKLEPLGLNRHFPFGAYGSDHEDRHRLPVIAVERANGATGRHFTGAAIVVVGDSIHDVRCGRDLGVRAVAVASGRTTRDQLAAESPDALLDDLTDTKAALRAILGPIPSPASSPG